ncbi:MAG TPA: cupin domain-containing protein [Dongiaceae bacterium]|jgi:quercetin dioxygenase-like cupin family protein|nr:cupin domain-containing protein [Dongiaceae bacterium]
MFTKFLLPWRKVAMAAVITAAGIATASTAMAGECPADKVVADGKGQAMGPTMPKDVTDTVLAHIDLAKEKVALGDHQFRMRQLVVQPGGIVPWHSHADRPALIYVVAGEITEYASTCAIPLVHKAGEVSVDAGRSHWWKNTGKKPVVLISSDILHDPNDVNM